MGLAAMFTEATPAAAAIAAGLAPCAALTSGGGAGVERALWAAAAGGGVAWRGVGWVGVGWGGVGGGCSDGWFYGFYLHCILMCIISAEEARAGRGEERRSGV